MTKPLDWVTGDWIQTYTGKQFWPIAPRVEDIDIDDIAHALANQCRYAGHCHYFYSVAEHSVHVARNVPKADRLWGLLHDATEAYLVDIPRPIKPYLTNYKEIEAKLMAAICERFGLPPEMPESIKRVDNAILMDERRENLSTPPAGWHDEGPGLGIKIKCWPPRLAEGVFMTEFDLLTSRSKA